MAVAQAIADEEARVAALSRSPPKEGRRRDRDVEERIRQGGEDDVRERLRALKAQYDPENVMGLAGGWKFA